jgi:hypothetical protein
MKEPYISVERASSIVLDRSASAGVLRLPYKIKFTDLQNKVKITDCIPLRFLMNAIRLSNLNHPETEDQPEPVDIRTIVSCYIFGSVVKPRYEKVKKKYLFGLYVTEKEERVIPNDIDIMCFVNNTYEQMHIKSLTSWITTISDGYGGHNVTRFCNFDISFIPVHTVMDYEYNKDFIAHIRDYGACIMGDNIIGAKRYASWNHDTIHDEITCNIPRDSNISGEKRFMEENSKIDRLEILDI